MPFANGSRAEIFPLRNENKLGNLSMSVLKKTVKGKVSRPLGLIIYGPDGVGKSTFVSKAPGVYFADIEKGTLDLNVERLIPETYQEFLDLLQALKSEKHSYKTLAVDSFDWLEKLIWDYACTAYSSKGKMDNIESFGYGKGYVYAEEVWCKLTNSFDELRDKKGMHVVLIGHSQTKAFQDPVLNTAYDRHILQLHQLAARRLRQWADCILFTDFKTNTYKDDTKKVRAVSDDERVMYTEKRASFDAKSRVTLPFEMELDWHKFYASYQLARDEEEDLPKKVASLLRQVQDPDIVKWTEEAMKKADRDKTLKIIGRLQNVIEAA